MEATLSKTTSVLTSLDSTAFNKKQSYLYAHTEVESLVSELSAWKQQAWKEFCVKLSDPNFPCLFSKRAWSSKSIHIIFCDKHEDENYSDFLHGLVQYTKYVNVTPLNKRLFSPLVVFFSPEFNQNKTQHETAWEALKWVIHVIYNHGQAPFLTTLNLQIGHFVLITFSYLSISVQKTIKSCATETLVHI